MFESINEYSKISIRRQIMNMVLFAVASGRMKADDKLPSHEKGGEKLGLDPDMVQRAYKILIVRGIMYAQGGRGSFISEGIGAKVRNECREYLAGRFYEVVCEAKAVGVSAGNVKEIVRASYDCEDGPYCEVPARIMKLAREVGALKK